MNGYYDPLLEMLDRAVAEKFLFPEHRRALLCETDPERLLEPMNLPLPARGGPEVDEAGIKD